jgi:heme oxygenase
VTLLERLRLETGSAHQRIERTLDITSRTATQAGYRALLTRFYGFHRVWEAAVAPLIADRAFFDPRRRTGLLARDLRALGLDRREIASLPACTPLMALPNRAAALGAMYVVEGSTLGGAIISRHVQRRLGLGPHTGCAYFGAYGKATGAMWRSFCARLLASSTPDGDDVVAAALDSFDILQRWLCAEARDERALRPECANSLNPARKRCPDPPTQVRSPRGLRCPPSVPS